MVNNIASGLVLVSELWYHILVYRDWLTGRLKVNVAPLPSAVYVFVHPSPMDAIMTHYGI
jgi:hypothetical protein